jgi:hypothetical protein
MKMELASTTAMAAALLVLSQGALAKTKVADIFGSYDAQCGINIDCTFGTGFSVTVVGTNGSSSPTEYDTPSLFIENPTAFTMTGASITATGYQAGNMGVTGTISLPNIPSHTILDVVWAGPTTKGDIFAYDYDDSFGHTQTNAGCTVGQALCALVGNFDVKFGATLNGGPISSDFSPDNTQDGGNQQGAFVGWEGLNPSGLSETVYDNHSGSTPGVLAFIFTGTQGSNVPEPATWAMMLTGFAGLGALGMTRWRRKKVSAAV